MPAPVGFDELGPRGRVEAIARWGVENRRSFSYSQGPDRWDQIKKPWQLPIMTDCSGWATTCYAWAGLPDPNGQHYGWGWTGTLATNGHEISLDEVEIGDLVIYWDNPSLVHEAGASSHVAIIVQADADPGTVSMGGNGDPQYCNVSQDGRAHRYFRYLPTEK